MTDFRRDRLLLKTSQGKPTNSGGGKGGGKGGGGGPKPPAPVATVTVSPLSFTVTQGSTQALTVVLKDANGNVLTGRTVTWSSSNTGVATVTSAGLVTGVAAGSVTITATSETKVGTSAGTIDAVTPPPPPAVASVTVSPSSFSVIIGATQQLTATVRDGSNNVLTGRLVTWASSNPSVATVNASGLVTGVAAGSATITATSETIDGTSAATVTLVPVATVTVAPATFSLQVNGQQQLTATVKDASGNVLTGRVVAWSSSSTSVATVDSVGHVTAITAGSVTITATSETKIGTSAGTVTPITVATVTVAPNPFTLQVGQTAQMTATARDSSGTTITGRAVTWQSTSPGVATVSASGLVTAVAPGSTTIRATVDGVQGTSAGTISAVPVALVSVSPSSFTLSATLTQQLTATTRDASSNILTGRVVTWASSNTAVATVSSAGLVTGVAVGSATITATSEGVQGTSAATITTAPAPAIANVTVTPSPFSVIVGATQQMTAVVRDTLGGVVNTPVVWTSNNPPKATVDASGLVVGIATGVATISATAGGVTGTATANVNPVPVNTVTVAPPSFSINVGATQQLTATTRDASNNILTGRVVTWASSNTTVATVSSSGLVTAVAAGSVTITATSETKTGTSAGTITVPPPAPAASVTVSPSSFTKSVGSTQLLTATVRDASNNVLTGRVITWASSNTGVATVTTPGQTATVTAVGAGSATITATCETIPGTSAATVTLVPVAQVTVAPTTFSVNAGATATLAATTKDASGNVLVGRTIVWTSSDVTKATVGSSSGVVTGVAAGSFTITATSEGIAGFSAGTVPGATVTPSPINSPSTTVYVPRPATWTLPTTFLDSRYNRGGTALTWARDVTLTDAGNSTTNTTTLQTEIDNASTRNGHTRLKLPAGWICDKIRLRKHTLGAFWTYIEASTLSSVEGARVNTSVMSTAPQIRSTTASETGAVFCDLGADYTRFVGIHFLATTGSPCYRLLYLQGTPNDFTEDVDTTAADLPQWIVVDRCWVDGGNISRVVNGIMANLKEFACVDSVINGVYFSGVENHGIVGYNGLGPWKIVGNQVEAGSISMLVGGNDPRIVGLQTSDIEVRRNFFTKRPSWNTWGAGWDGISKVTKNLFELKWGNRVLVEGNVFDGCYYSEGGSQRGAFLVWKVENSNNGNTTVTTANVTYRYNLAKNVAGAYEFQGVGVGGTVGAPLHRVEHMHNCVQELASDGMVPSGSHTRGFFYNNGATDILVDHDTLCIAQASASTRFTGPITFAGTVDEAGLVIRNSLLMLPITAPPNASDSRSVFGDGSQAVTPTDNATNTFQTYAPGYSFLNNVLVKLVGSVSSGYPATSRYTDTVASVQCVAPAAGNFALLGSSPYKGICADGSDPGCDMSLVNLAIAGVACGLVSDHTQRLEPSGVSRPAYLAPVTDPTYRTLVTRITGDPGTAILTAGAVSLGTWSTINTHNYSKDPVWNADQTLMVLKRVSGLGVPLFLDGSTYVPVFTRSYPSGTAETRWSSTDPDVMMVITSAGALKSWNVRTNAVTTVYTATGYSACGFSLEGDFSTDMRYIAILATRNSDSKQVGFVIDTVGLTKTPDIDLVANGITSADVVGVSALGTYVVVTGSITGATTVGGAYDAHKVFTASTGAYLGQFFSEYGRPSHYDHAVDLSGNEVIVGVSKSAPDEGFVIMRRLSNGTVTILNNGGYAAHTSCRNTVRPGWAYVSHSYNGPSWPPYRDEVFAVKLDGSKSIERFCNLHTLNTVDYDAEPHSCPTPDGKRIIFATDWESATNRPSHAFVVDARGICP